MRRRHLLSTAAAAAAAGLAGCSSLPGTGSSGERARYDSWVRDDDDGDVAAVTLDLSTYRELGESGTATATETPAADPETDDPLLLIPAAYLLGGALAVGFGVRYGLSDTIESDGGAEYAHVVDGAIVLEGEFDADVLAASVEDEAGEAVESYEGYELFRTGGLTGDAVVAVSGDAVVVVSAEDADDPVEAARSYVDANADGSLRYSASDDDYDALATALPRRGVTGVTYSADGGLFGGDAAAPSDSDETGLASFSDLDLSGALGGAVSASFSGSSVTSSVALRYDSADAIESEADIEAALADDADDVNVTIDGRTAVIEATYSDAGVGS